MAVRRNPGETPPIKPPFVSSRRTNPKPPFKPRPMPGNDRSVPEDEDPRKKALMKRLGKSQ
jgi:hypothetical protein